VLLLVKGLLVTRQIPLLAERSLNFAEIRSVNEPIMIGAPTLAKLGFGFDKSPIELRHLDMSFPMLKSGVGAKSRLTSTEYAHVVGPVAAPMQFVDRGDSEGGWIRDESPWDEYYRVSKTCCSRSVAHIVFSGW